jgi:NAD(P)-dependent dehydrogenase (short-subunit alcohol dehydrogenase family)
VEDRHLHFYGIPGQPQSKTANVLFAVGATARWADDGITANALNPGTIKTSLQRYLDGRLATPPERRKTTQQGAATTVLLATSPCSTPSAVHLSLLTRLLTDPAALANTKAVRAGRTLVTLPH